MRWFAASGLDVSTMEKAILSAVPPSLLPLLHFVSLLMISNSENVPRFRLHSGYKVALLSCAVPGDSKGLFLAGFEGLELAS